MSFPSRRGLWFDAAVFAGNLFLLGLLTDFVKKTDGFHPFFGVLILCAAVLNAVGAGLKRRPLQYRIASAHLPSMHGGIALGFFVLAVMHLGLFMLCALVGAEMIRGTPAGGSPMRLWQVVEAFGLMIVGLAPTVMTVGVILKPRTPPQPSPSLGRREAWADLALYTSCMIILAWWNGTFVELFAGVQAGLPMRLLLIVLITVPFSIFYLAPRILFLLEDYRRPRTWLGVFLVMLPLAVRLVFR